MWHSLVSSSRSSVRGASGYDALRGLTARGRHRVFLICDVYFAFIDFLLILLCILVADESDPDDGLSRSMTQAKPAVQPSINPDDAPVDVDAVALTKADVRHLTKAKSSEEHKVGAKANIKAFFQSEEKFKDDQIQKKANNGLWLED